MQKNTFKKKQINFEDIPLVLEAIKVHSNGFDTDNMIALTLIFADKLDIQKTRVTPEDKNIEGMRLLYIDDIEIEIQDNLLTINFLVNDQLTLEELNNFYFTKKVFKATEAFAKKLNLNSIICLNQKKLESTF